MKALNLLFLLLFSSTILVSAQLNIKSISKDSCTIVTSNSDNIVNSSDPIVIVEMDSLEFVIDNTTMQKLNHEWIQSIKVQQQKEMPEKYYSFRGKDLSIITPMNHSKDEFYDLIQEQDTRRKKLDNN